MTLFAFGSYSRSGVNKTQQRNAEGANFSHVAHTQIIYINEN